MTMTTTTMPFTQRELSKIVSIGNYRIAHLDDDVLYLVTIGLGSCVGIAIYDPVLKLGGLAHVMLPDSTHSRKSIAENESRKFADTAIKEMFQKMIAKGARASRCIVKIAGGAKMFASVSFDIGAKNVEATRCALKEIGLKIAAEDILGTTGRTISLELGTGELHVRTVGKSIAVL